MRPSRRWGNQIRTVRRVTLLWKVWRLKTHTCTIKYTLVQAGTRVANIAIFKIQKTHTEDVSRDAMRAEKCMYRQWQFL